jgi:hypothetical protein
VWADLPQLPEALLFCFLQILWSAEKEKGWPVVLKGSKGDRARLLEAVCLGIAAEPAFSAEKPDGSNVSK